MIPVGASGELATVAAFTDTYLPTINGVTYTVHDWRAAWRDRGGTMPVVYPRDGSTTGMGTEYPVESVPFPFYPGFRLASPRVPTEIAAMDLDVVHVHTPFTLGLAGRRLAAPHNVPVVASYHTPAREYAAYLSTVFDATVQHAADRYEQWFFDGADAVIVPTDAAASHIQQPDTPVYVVSNGVDIEQFQPASEAAVTAFRDRYSLPDGPLVGYTGRHGYEKQLEELLAATVDLDGGVVLAGDGPARPDLQRRAAARDDVQFLGFLDRADLSTFYAALDVFAFPSPIETQGLVALEAIACGTPVVAVDGGALTETVVEGETGYHYPSGDINAFQHALRDALQNQERLTDGCLACREALSIERSIDKLHDVYNTVT